MKIIVEIDEERLRRGIKNCSNLNDEKAEKLTREEMIEFFKRRNGYFGVQEVELVE